MIYESYCGDEDVSWVDQYLKPGMVAVDVGACQGDVVRPMAVALQGEGSIIAIEPMASRREALERIDPVVRVLTMALGDHEGDATFYPSRAPEHGSLYEKAVLKPEGDPFTTRLATLDGLQASGEIPPHVDLLKIDAQGADGPILRGAVNMLRTQRPVVYVEVWPLGLTEAGDSVAALGAFLRDLNYVVQDARSWEILERDTAAIGGHGSHDWLAVPAERAA